ncbi:hypothetical protein B7494_g1905 [Chlorociboria aeruginascens]|nr:hypothetical protein B7494_g1905 [Chlorociboria aeruginascens]
MNFQQPGKETRQQYGAFQNQIYNDGMLGSKFPTVTTDPNKLEAQAKEHLKPTAFNYVAGGAGERATMDANRLAFRQWKMIPRMLQPTSSRDLTVTLFEEKYDTPILMAPIGVQGIFHEDKETGLSQVCSEIGVPYILSTASTSSIEEVAAANGVGPRWYQLYWPQDDSITISLLQRAKASGYKVLVVTLDTWALAWRPADLDAAFVPFITGTGNKVGLTDPAFREKFKKSHGATPEEKLLEASHEWVGDVFSGKAHTWDQIKLLKDNWDGPVVLKGIQHVDDARLAVEHGCEGIIVSNHGGRQLDGAIGSLEVLPEIVEAVGDRTTILFDSGIRTGVDIIKALSLGAQAVLIGRPAIYGLAVNGKKGAKEVLQGILADLDQSMGLAGIKDIAGCNRSMLRRVQYGGDIKIPKPVITKIPHFSSLPPSSFPIPTPHPQTQDAPISLYPLTEPLNPTPRFGHQLACFVFVSETKISSLGEQEEGKIMQRMMATRVRDGIWARRRITQRRWNSNSSQHGEIKGKGTEIGTGKKTGSAHVDFYKTFTRPVAKVLLMATFTYQFAYWAWVKLEKDELKAEKLAEVQKLEKELANLKAEKGMLAQNP